MAIDLSELTYDLDFCTQFQIEKQSDHVWEKGRQTTTKTRITVTGIASPSSAEDVEVLDVGDRKHGTKTFYTNMKDFKPTDTLTTSDAVIWNGKKYKLLHVFDYRPNGYMKAIGELLGGDEDEQDSRT